MHEIKEECKGLFLWRKKNKSFSHIYHNLYGHTSTFTVSQDGLVHKNEERDAKAKVTESLFDTLIWLYILVAFNQ